MSRVLVVGASRGIGLGLAERHVDDGWDTVVTTRDGLDPTNGVTTHRLDVRDGDQLRRMIEAIESPFDRVIHNAGVMRRPVEELMAVNAEAPITVIEALLDAELVASGGVVAIMTSQMGARRGRTASLGGYGDSKAALNDEFRRRADDWATRGITAIVMHPGWVRTDMGGSGASISVHESVDGIVTVLDRLTPDQHGSFLTWRGDIHPW